MRHFRVQLIPGCLEHGNWPRILLGTKCTTQDKVMQLHSGPWRKAMGVFFTDFRCFTAAAPEGIVDFRFKPDREDGVLIWRATWLWSTAQMYNHFDVWKTPQVQDQTGTQSASYKKKFSPKILQSQCTEQRCYFFYISKSGLCLSQEPETRSIQNDPNQGRIWN